MRDGTIHGAMAANLHCDRDWFDLLPRIACPVMLPRHAACAVPLPDHNVYLSDPEAIYGHFDRFFARLA